MLTLEQLMKGRTKEEWKAALLLALQGVGFVSQSGSGAGGLSLSGVAKQSASVIVEVLTTGERGAATYRYSLDGGTTWTGALTIPSGSAALGSTGVVLTFTDSPSSADLSFVDGDTFAFSLATPTFPVTSWQPGSTGLTLLEVEAEALANLDELLAKIASGGFTSYASGEWLDLLADNHYDLRRVPAAATKGMMLLTDEGGGGPFTITVGQLTATSADGLRYINTTGGTLPASGSLSLEFQAESPGAAYNKANGSVVLLITPLPGVAISNPAYAGGSWITVQGSDAETDESLRARCRGRWAGYGGATAAAYEAWVREAPSGEAATRVLVQKSLAVPGQVDVYAAGAAGGLAAESVATVQEYVDARIPLASSCVVAAATSTPVTVSGTVAVVAGKHAAAQVAAEAALNAYFAAIPIGGNSLVGGSRGISREALIAAIARQDGVLDINLTLPAADVVLGATEVGALTLALTWVDA